MVASFCVWNEDYKAFYSGYAFAAPANFLDVYFVFLALFYWLRTKVGWASSRTAEFSGSTLIVSHLLPSFLTLGPP